MTKSEFKKAFKKCNNDKNRWLLVMNNKNCFEQIYIDIDAIDIIIDDDNNVSFDNFGDVALYDLLKALDIKADFV